MIGYTRRDGIGWEDMEFWECGVGLSIKCFDVAFLFK